MVCSLWYCAIVSGIKPFLACDKYLSKLFGLLFPICVFIGRHTPLQRCSQCFLQPQPTEPSISLFIKVIEFIYNFCIFSEGSIVVSLISLKHPSRLAMGAIEYADCTSVRGKIPPAQTSVLDMALQHLVLRLKSLSFGECVVPLYCYYFQVHSDLLVSYV